MPRPNILFIVDDQHRHDYLGAAGADFLRTPHLDRLAAAGVRFTQCTTNAPVCAPARIGLASGLQPSRLGCLDNSGRLPLGTTTYYQRLRDAGYRVGCVGKLDLRKSDGYNGRYGDRPYVYSWGFTDPEECEGKMHAGSSPTPIGPYTHYLAAKGQLATFHQDYRQRAAAGWSTDCRDSPLDSADFEDAYIGRRAAEWIAHVPDDFPWHYFVSFVGPHDPFDPPIEYGDRYRDATMPPAIDDSLAGKPSGSKNAPQTSRPTKSPKPAANTALPSNSSTTRSARSSTRSKNAASSTTPISSSPPTTANCSATTGCTPRAPRTRPACAYR